MFIKVGYNSQNSKYKFQWDEVVRDSSGNGAKDLLNPLPLRYNDSKVVLNLLLTHSFPMHPFSISRKHQKTSFAKSYFEKSCKIPTKIPMIIEHTSKNRTHLHIFSWEFCKNVQENYLLEHFSTSFIVHRFICSQRREMLLLLLYNDENYVNPFQPNVPFLYPLKTVGFLTFSGGIVMEDLTRTC